MLLKNLRGLGKILIHPHERFTWGIIKLVLVDSEAGLSQKNVAKLEEFATHTERVLTKPAINLKLSHQEWTVPLAKCLLECAIMTRLKKEVREGHLAKQLFFSLSNVLHFVINGISIWGFSFSMY